MASHPNEISQRQDSQDATKDEVDAKEIREEAVEEKLEDPILTFLSKTRVQFQNKQPIKEERRTLEKPPKYQHIFIRQVLHQKNAWFWVTKRDRENDKTTKEAVNHDAVFLFPTKKQWKNDPILSTKPFERVVFFEAKFHEISDITMQNETFDATLRIYLTWLASMKDVESYNDLKEGEEWKPEWEPRIEVENFQTGTDRTLPVTSRKLIVASDYTWLDGVTGEGYEGKSALGFNARLGIWCRIQIEFGGTFVEEFELQSFPFDCQDLKILFRSKNCKQFVPLPTDQSYLSYSPLRSTLADFEVVTIGAEFGVSPAGFSRGGQIYGEFSLVVKAKRNWTSRLDVLISQIGLTFLSLVVFALEPAASTETGDLGNRVNYLMTLILTDIALQQFVKSGLDDFDYFTALDKFIWSSFLFKVVVLVWVALPFYPILFKNIEAFADVKKTNEVATLVFTIVFFIWLISSFIYFTVIRHVEERKLFKSICEIDNEFLKDAHYFSMTLDDEKLWKFVQPKDSENAEPDYYERYIQYGERNNANSFLRATDENKVPPTFHFKYHDYVWELAGIYGIAFFAQIIVLFTWIVRSVLREGLITQMGIIYGFCIGGSLATMIVYIEKDSTWYHDLFMSLAFIVNSLFLLLQAQGSCQSNHLQRIWGMNLIVMTWYGLRGGFEFKYAMDFANEEERFAGKYLYIYNTGTGEDGSASVKTIKLWTKYIVLGAYQAFVVFIFALPLFAIQLPPSGAKAGSWWMPDFGGFVFALLSFSSLILSLVFRDSRSAWEEPLAFRDAIRQFSEKEKIDLNEEKATEEDRPKSKGSHVNPFNYVRFPVVLSEIFLWIAVCLISLVVCWENVFALIGLLSPVFAVVYYGGMLVTLLEHESDDAFGDKVAYQEYKKTTGRIFPVIPNKLA